MSFYARQNQDNKGFSSTGATQPTLCQPGTFSGVNAILENAVKSSLHWASFSSPDVYTSQRCMEPHNVCHLEKTAQTCLAALIFLYKSILFPLNHLGCSSLNLLQFVYILLGLSCLKVNTPFKCGNSPCSPWQLLATHFTARRIPCRAPAVSRVGNGPSPVSKEAVSFCSWAGPFVIFSVWLSGCGIRKSVVALHIPESHIAGDVRLYRWMSNCSLSGPPGEAVSSQVVKGG